MKISRRHVSKLNNSCTSCGKSLDRVGACCIACQAKANTRQRLKRQNLVASGLCGYCGKESKKPKCLECFNKKSPAQKLWLIRTKNEVFNAYGNKCVCCGETEPKFLQLDHVNNDGAAHRKEMKHSGSFVYSYAKKHNYPDIFQLLCANCNWAKGLFGECPHKTTRCLVSSVEV